MLRLIRSGLLPRRPGCRDCDCACAHGELVDLMTGSSSGLYDCDCGLFVDSSRSYDCDCGLFVDSSRSYDCDCGLFLHRTDASAVPLASNHPPSRPSTLSAWLHVTEACNLDCPYCYVRKRPTTMSRDVGRRAVEKLAETAARHAYSALKLKYAGGEPALSFSLVQDLHSHATRCAARAGLGLEGVLLSNGVALTAQMLDFLAHTGLRLMISLDGGPDAHDRVRARRDGRSTYDAVARTVELALDKGLRPTLSITLTAPALDGSAEAVAFALERDLPFNLNFYREHDSGARRLSPLVPDLDSLVGTVRGILNLIDTYPAYPLPLAGILDRIRLDIPHDTACSAGRDYMAVSTRGQVSACQMLLEDPWASLDDADPLHLIRQSGASIFAEPSEGSGCHICPWRTACGGGCPLMRDTLLHAHYCQAYQILLPELVRLEAKRLIAAHHSQPPYFL